MNCLACNTATDRTTLLTCTGCKGAYHYGCNNITSAEFRENCREYKQFWICPMCLNITKRRKNDDTSARSRLSKMLQDTNMSFDGGEDVLEDTVEPPKSNSRTETPTNTEVDNISYEKFSQLLKLELQNVKISITTEITRTVTNILTQQINTAFTDLRNEINKNTESLQSEQTNIQQKLSVLNDKINSLEKENNKLKSEVQHVTQKSNNQNQQVENTKKIVLYGLNEYDYENEDDLIKRVTNIFSEVMTININPYIENIHRIGKKGYRRPVEIELISQRMTRYLLQNKYSLRNTGIAITKFMNLEDLKQKRILRETLQEARQKGPAYIKGNKVYLENKEYTSTNNPTNTQSDGTSHEHIAIQDTSGIQTEIHDENGTKNDPKVPSGHNFRQ